MLKLSGTIALIVSVSFAGMAIAAPDDATADATCSTAQSAVSTAPMRTIESPSAVTPAKEELSEVFCIHPMNVNLLNGETEATLDLPQPGNLKLVLYDRLGREVMTLQDGEMDSGRHTFVFREYRLPIQTFYLRVSYRSEQESVDKHVFL